MARRSNKQTEAPAEVTTPTEEAPVSTDTTPEAPASTEAKAVEPDLTAFKSAVATAIEESDSTTGDVPEAQVAEVTAAYRALEGIKAKNLAKQYVNDEMASAMNDGSLPRARAHLQLSEKALVAAAGGAKEKVPADPTENFVQRVATLQLGYALATSNVPEGVNADWQDRVTALVGESNGAATELFAYHASTSEDKGEEPDASAVVRNAVKLAQGKAAKAGVSRGGGTFTGERRDIGAHIENAFEALDEGDFLTIAEIRNTRSEEYGDNPPSAGAISARLFPKSGESSMVKVGIQPDTNESGKKGARKVAVAE